MEPFVTPGVHRVWRLASDVARQRQSEQVEPEHLLWALVIDESRAAEILVSYHITSQRLQELVPPQPEWPAPHAEGGEPLLPRSDTLERVFVEARRLATRAGRYAEVATEHLLCGLATVESPVQKLLLDQGLQPANAAGHATGPSGISTEPLAADVRLSLTGPPAGENTDLYRVLDAAANRAREGLRVLEDYVRFTNDDRHLTEILKGWRHRLADALRLLDGRALITSRDTRGDVGTTVHTRSERTRETPLDVVRASCKRVQEAARTLEEFGKIVSPEFALMLGELRYASYTIEKAILTTFESRDRLADFRLYLLVTQALCPHGAGPVIRAALAAGASVIQVREKNLPDRELVTWGHYVREWTAAAGALFIMNDRPDLAVLTDADGVHVGQEELSVRDARRIVGPHKLVGVSTHSIEQARIAVLEGADYIGVGPVFPSTTKSFPELAGLDFVRQVAAEITLPAFAIGGIDAGNVAEVVAAGAQRIAVSSAICGVEHPGQATRDLLGRMTS
jgi:thiamine-phosphate pyrophosphorylase